MPKKLRDPGPAHERFLHQSPYAPKGTAQKFRTTLKLMVSASRRNLRNSTTSCFLVLECSLAGICWCHEMALELVCRAEFWCNRHCKQDEPRRSTCSLGPSLAAHRPKTDPNMSGQTAIRYPGNHFFIWASVATFGYGCGYNLCGCNLRLSEVRSGSFVVDLGPVTTPTGPRTLSSCSHISCNHIDTQWSPASTVGGLILDCAPARVARSTARHCAAPAATSIDSLF